MEFDIGDTVYVIYDDRFRFVKSYIYYKYHGQFFGDLAGWRYHIIYNGGHLDTANLRSARMMLTEKTKKWNLTGAIQ